MALDKHAILAAVPKPTVKAVDVPEWGGEVYIRSLSVGEVDRYESAVNQWTKGNSPGHGCRALLVAMGLCDESGKRLFTDADANGLSNHPDAVMQRLCTEIRVLSGMDPAQQDDAAKK